MKATRCHFESRLFTQPLQAHACGVPVGFPPLHEATRGQTQARPFRLSCTSVDRASLEPSAVGVAGR